VNVKVNVKEVGKARGWKGAGGKKWDWGLRIGGAWTIEFVTLGGGVKNSCSLAQLSGWCEKKFRPRKVESDPKPRPYDLPWVVMDSTRAKRLWGSEVRTSLETIFSEIADS